MPQKAPADLSCRDHPVVPRWKAPRFWLAAAYIAIICVLYSQRHSDFLPPPTVPAPNPGPISASIEQPEKNRPAGGAPLENRPPPPQFAEKKPRVGVKASTEKLKKQAVKSDTVAAADKQKSTSTRTGKAADPRKPKVSVVGGDQVAATEKGATRTKTRLAVQKEWRIVLAAGLDDCRQLKGYFERTLCREKLRWKYCSPGRWDTVAECATE